MSTNQPALAPFAQRVLRVLTVAQRQILLDVIAECRDALDALVDIQLGARPDPSAWQAKSDAPRRKAIEEWTEAGGAALRRLNNSIGALAHLIGDIGVPDALRAIWQAGLDPAGAGWPDPYREEDWQRAVRETAKQARADLHALCAAAAADSAPDRPQVPTAAYCLLTGYRVRWNGERDLPPLLWQVLEYLLSREGSSVPVGDLEEGVALWHGKVLASKTVPNTLSRLNEALLSISFPWEWHVRAGHVHRAG
jgi:hypothetical protein